MKVRDSGMPEEAMWERFFDPVAILAAFGIHRGVRSLVEFGCGYGTFTLASARFVRDMVYAFDIEPELVVMVKNKSHSFGLKNIQVFERDFIGEGTGLPDNSIDAVLMFNILHHEEPLALMAEAWRVLKPDGILAVIHWNHDPSTPRGPSLDIRPRPEQCIAWGRTAGFSFEEHHRFDFPPYHYGLKFTKLGEIEKII